MIPVDVLVIGGGIQGLVLAHELLRQGYATTLVTNADLGSGQTLHSHGVLNSGYLFPSRELRESLARDWLPFAEERGVQLYGEEEWYIVTPPGPYNQLRPGWEAGNYEYEALPTSALPPGFACDPQLSVLKVKEYNYPKRQMVRALSSGIIESVLRGEVLTFRCTPVEHGGARQLQIESVTIGLHRSGERIELAPRAIISAAGGGTRRLFEALTRAPSFARAVDRAGASVGEGQRIIVTTPPVRNRGLLRQRFPQPDTLTPEGSVRAC